jgi:hypothetical protein
VKSRKLFLAQVAGQAWSFPQEEKSTEAGGTGQALMAGAGGAQGNPAQRALQASERANPDGGGDATADRPGRLIPLIPSYAEIQRIRETIEL